MGNRTTAGYVSGVAVHWYADWLVPPSVLDATHYMFPNVPILYTEACTGIGGHALFKITNSPKGQAQITLQWFSNCMRLVLLVGNMLLL